MDAPMIPREKQEEVIQATLKDHSHMCAADRGAGKTLIGTEVALRSGVAVTLVVAPLNTLAGWRKTVERQSRGQMPFHDINRRKAGQEAFGRLTRGERGVYFIGTEYFRRFGWAKFPIGFLCLDEGHRFQNRKSLSATILKTTARAEYKLYLSATPSGNRIEGLWSGAHWLWPDKYRFFWPWVTEFCKTVKDSYAGKKIVGEKNPGAAWADLPSKSMFPSPYTDEPNVVEVEVELSALQRKLYNKFEKDAIVWLEDNPLVADLPAIKALRLREITLAVPSIRYDENGDELVYFEDDAKSSKIDAVKDILTDIHAAGPVPVLIFTHSRKFARPLTLQLQQAGYEARMFVGGMSQEERDWKLDNFGVEFDVMVATIPSLAEGVDGLQLVCHNEIWASVTDDRVVNYQAKGRLARPGQTKTVNRWMIQAKDTVEVRQAGRLKADQDLLDESYAAALESA